MASFFTRAHTSGINGRTICFIFNLNVHELASDWFGTSRRFNFKHSTQSNIESKWKLDIAHSDDFKATHLSRNCETCVRHPKILLEMHTISANENSMIQNWIKGEPRRTVRSYAKHWFQSNGIQITRTCSYWKRNKKLNSTFNIRSLKLLFFITWKFLFHFYHVCAADM